jgi:hypothetical protein
MSNVRRPEVNSVGSSLLASALSAFALTAGAAPAETVASLAPFQSVVARGNTIVASLPPRLRIHVTEGGAAKPRLTQPGEVFTLAPGASLVLTERHSSYLVTARMGPISGVEISATIDRRSMGGEVSKKQYFIRANH